jgi:hypothetical protein
VSDIQRQTEGFFCATFFPILQELGAISADPKMGRFGLLLTSEKPANKCGQSICRMKSADVAVG